MIKGVSLKTVLFFLFFSQTDVVFGAPVSEYSLRAAFIANFAKFAEFPNNKEKRTFCVYKNREIWSAYSDLVENQSNEKLIPSLLELDTLNSIEECDLLYKAKFDNNSFRENLITISEKGGGGLFEFILVDQKLKFSLSMEQVKKSKIYFPVQLLNLALKND
jgi:hypothetical protein